MNVYLVDMHNRDMRWRLVVKCETAQEALETAKAYLATEKVEIAYADVQEGIGHDSRLLIVNETIKLGPDDWDLYEVVETGGE